MKMMNKKARFDFWDFLMWVGGITILVWALLKSFRIIESPIWIEMLPYIAIGLSILGGAYKFGKIIRGVEHTNKKVNILGREFHEIKEDFIKVKYNQELCMSGKLINSPYKK